MSAVLGCYREPPSAPQSLEAAVGSPAISASIHCCVTRAMFSAFFALERLPVS